MAKPKTRGRKAGTKNRKATTWDDKYQHPTSVSDYGTIEMWRKTVGVQLQQVGKDAHKEVYHVLTLKDRVIDPGGRVVAKGTEDEFEHPALDPMRKIGILDDDPGRAETRVRAGVELLRLGVEGRVLSKSTATWRAVGGSSTAGISQADCENVEARNEMRYLRAKDAVGEDDWEMVRSICIDGLIPTGTKRRRLVNALDLLGEFLLGEDPPADVVRPRMKVRDRTPPPWLKAAK